jgi:hypothetical protein
MVSLGRGWRCRDRAQLPAVLAALPRRDQQLLRLRVGLGHIRYVVREALGLGTRYSVDAWADALLADLAHRLWTDAGAAVVGADAPPDARARRPEPPPGPPGVPPIPDYSTGRGRMARSGENYIVPSWRTEPNRKGGGLLPPCLPVLYAGRAGR